MRRQIALACLLLSTVSGAYAQETEDQRRRPGPTAPETPLPPIDPTAVEPPSPILPRETIAVPDRWRIVDSIGVTPRWWDPYSQNKLKADRPLFGDWFINVGMVSDTVFEPRSTPLPVAGNGSENPNSLDQFGRLPQTAFVQTIIGSISLIQGDTAFRPPDIEIRLTPAFQFNRVQVPENRLLNIDPSRGSIRTDHAFALQEGFVDYHLRNVSSRYDFDSLRVGIQPINLDFRGFLFLDQQLGARVFGNRSNNLWQYNLGYIRRLEKDTNSGLNDITRRPRHDEVFFANLYRQDLPVKGYTVEAVVAYNRNREGNDKAYYDTNGFLVRPASIGVERPTNYDVVYAGFNGDGHFGRLNLTHAFYGAFGHITANPFTSLRRPDPAQIRAFLRRQNRPSTSTGCASVCKPCMPPATRTPTTTRPAASTPSWRTRSSPARRPATGCAKRCR